MPHRSEAAASLEDESYLRLRSLSCRAVSWPNITDRTRLAHSVHELVGARGFEPPTT